MKCIILGGIFTSKLYLFKATHHEFTNLSRYVIYFNTFEMLEYLFT